MKKYSFISDEKGVSETLGYIFILGIIIASISIIYVHTSSELSTSQDIVKYRSMVQGFRKIQNIIDYTAYANNPEKTIRILINSGRVYITGNDTIKIEVRMNNTTQYQYQGEMGSIEYSYKDQKISFENGGVWLKKDDQVSMIFEPRIFIYKKNVNNETIVFIALVKIQGRDSVAGSGFVDLKVKFNNTDSRIFDGGGYINMNITSEYAEAWEDYFDGMRGYVNNTVLQTQLSGNTVSVQIYFDRLILTLYTIDTEIQLHS